MRRKDKRTFSGEGKFSTQNYLWEIFWMHYRVKKRFNTTQFKVLWESLKLLLRPVKNVYSWFLAKPLAICFGKSTVGWNKCAHLLFLSIDDIYLIRMTKNISFSIWFQRRKWLSLQNENLNALDFEGQFVHLLGIKCKFVGGPNSESRFSSFWPKRSSYLFLRPC